MRTFLRDYWLTLFIGAGCLFVIVYASWGIVDALSIPVLDVRCPR